MTIAGREAKAIKPDVADCYQLTLSSKLDVQKVVDFFSSGVNYPLSGYKLKQYNVWIRGLRKVFAIRALFKEIPGFYS